MLYWKTKPINKLTKSELQEALSESVKLVLLKQEYRPLDEWVTSFATGIIVGTIIALCGVYLASG
jgi:hypothetical protein